MKISVKHGLPARAGNKKGMTILETVVALAVIGIISFAAIGFINSFSRLSVKTADENKATLFAENALECFKFADSADEFENALNALNEVASIDKREDGAYVYTAGSYTVVVTATYPGSGESGTAEFGCTVTNSDGQVLASVDSYKKGVTAV